MTNLTQHPAYALTGPTPLFSKLQLGARKVIRILNAPASFEPELTALKSVQIRRRISASRTVAFGMAFAITNAQLDAVSAKLTKAAIGDALLWIAYPKGTSTKYRCEFNRDSEWRVLKTAGYESVRMVAIDADWSALRFRKKQFVKSTIRSD